MTVHEMTAGVGTSMPHHHLSRSRFMITDILSGHSGQRSPPSPASSDGPRDLSLHSRDSELSDGHESGTDSGLPGENSSVCSNGEWMFRSLGYRRSGLRVYCRRHCYEKFT